MRIMCLGFSRSFSSLGLDVHARMDVCTAPLTLPSLEECVALELCRGAWHSSLRMTKTVATHMCSTVEACFQELEQKLRSQGLSTGEGACSCRTCTCACKRQGASTTMLLLWMQCLMTRSSGKPAVEQAADSGQQQEHSRWVPTAAF